MDAGFTFIQRAACQKKMKNKTRTGINENKMLPVARLTRRFFSCSTTLLLDIKSPDEWIVFVLTCANYDCKYVNSQSLINSSSSFYRFSYKELECMIKIWRRLFVMKNLFATFQTECVISNMTIATFLFQLHQKQNYSPWDWTIIKYTSIKDVFLFLLTQF